MTIRGRPDKVAKEHERTPKCDDQSCRDLSLSLSKAIEAWLSRVELTCDDVSGSGSDAGTGALR